MCMPRRAWGSLPVTSQEMVVGADSEACSNETTPLTDESPRMTATGGRREGFSVVLFGFGCWDGGDVPALTMVMVVGWLLLGSERGREMLLWVLMERNGEREKEREGGRES